MNNVFLLRNATTYIKEHNGKCFVFALTQEALTSDNLDNIAEDLLLLHCLGIKLILTYHLFTPYQAVTFEQLQAILLQINQFEWKIKTSFSRILKNKVPIVQGNFVSAKPCGIINCTDLQYKGNIRKIDTKSIQNYMQDAIVLFSPVGISSTGELFFLDGFNIATTTACQIKADKLIFLHSPITQNGQVIPELTSSQFDLLPAYLQNNITSCNQQIHIVDYQENGAILLELFTKQGSGNLIIQSPFVFENATVTDIDGILTLIAPLIEKQILVARNYEQIQNEITSFMIVKDKNKIIACAQLKHINQNAAEFACLAVDEHYQNQSLAEKLLKKIIQKAGVEKYQELFALTTHTGHWFLEQGFVKVDINALPAEKKANYNQKRQSQIYQKAIL
jgi:amino-acid N-acetyltransferase